MVFVIAQNGVRLMPTTERKARLLLKTGRAEIFRRMPFTIRLLYQSGTATQKCTLGIDTGESHIGISAVSEGHVLCRTEITLRSSMEKRKLMETRMSYRRGRRFRNTPYRHPKYRPHTKRVYSSVPDKKGHHWLKQKNKYTSDRPAGWLPPSIQSKVDHHVRWVMRFLDVLPEDTKLRIEVARFDVARMKDPSVHGDLYQRGRLYDYENVKAYVLAKFGYKCPVCGHKFDNNHKARMHHLTYRSNGATDNPDEYAPVCDKCHTPENHLEGEILDKLRKTAKRKEYREPVFMNIVAKRLRQIFPDASFTYGNITKADREALGLSKSHANDGVAIAAGTDGCDTQHLPPVVYIRQVRKKKRSLHEATPRKGQKMPNRMAVRNSKNTPKVITNERTYYLYDTVLYDGREGCISGFTGTSAYVTDAEGNYITQAGKTYKQIPLSKLTVIRHNNNWVVA